MWRDPGSFRRKAHNDPELRSFITYKEDLISEAFKIEKQWIDHLKKYTKDFEQM